MTFLNNSAKLEESRNCRNMNNRTLDGKCLASNIYKTQITPNQPNFKDKFFIQTAKTNLTTTQNHSTSKIMKTRRNYQKNIGQQNVTISHQEQPGKKNKGMCTFQHNQNKMLPVSKGKVRNRFIQRRQFIKQKVRTYN